MAHVRQTILVVRRQDKLPQTLSALKAHHLPVVGLPIMATAPCKINIPSGIKGLILTSSAAIPAAKGSDLPCYCVGPKTAKEAKKAGLKVIYIGTKGGDELAHDIAQKFPPQHVCHLTTEQAEIEWYTILKNAGFSIKTLYAYKTTDLTELPHEVVCCFKENRVSSIMFFSSRGAERTYELLKTAGFDINTVPNFIAISQQVAQTLADKGAPFSQIQVAAAPTSEDIINVLEQSLKPEKPIS